MEGSLTVLFGPMFASKTTSLLGKLMSEASIGLKVLYINNEMDTREIPGSKSESFTTHNLMYGKASETFSIESEMISFIKTSSLPPLESVDEFQVIGIDEYQFFDTPNNDTVLSYADHGKIVYVAGLCSDFNRNGFGNILDLLRHADFVIHLSAFCKQCSKTGCRKRAIYTHRIEHGDESVVKVGGSEEYMPVCRSCYLQLQ